jgi:hypothetical protein
MGLRRWSIRMRIFLLVAIPILTLIGLYVFTATTTASNAINLTRSRAVKDTIATPIGALVTSLDTERLMAVIYLAAPVPRNLAALDATEHKTDLTVTGYKAAAGAALGSASAAEAQALTVMTHDLTRLPGLRSQIAAQTISRPAAIGAYDDILAQDDAVLTQIVVQNVDVHLAFQSLVLVRTAKVVETLLQEDALLTGDLISRTFPAADREQFAELAGGHRALYSQVLSELDPSYRATYERVLGPQVLGPLEALENKVIADPRPGRIPPVSLTSWNAAVQGVAAGFNTASNQVSEPLTTTAQPIADSVFLRLILAGGLGLLGVVLSIIMSLWIGRGLVQQLAELRRTALDLATKRLPGVMERLRAGQDVDVSAEAPPLEASSDEIGQVMAAFNAVQQTAVEAAVDEARLRRGVGDVFRNLARRSQSLLHRQLALLDNMERRASEPEELENLFRIDHLTTRMRRHSESLIILSGEAPGRGWRHPVRLVDVLRAAVAEVEDYTRIRVTTGTQAALVGRAVADVIHLIAELAENATMFSPPNAPVLIHGDIVGRGFAVEIEDRGLGIAEEKLAQVNHDLEHPPQFDLSGSEQLGLFVAGQLARRHDIRITLQSSAYGGITAIVLIPQDLIVDDAEAGTAAATERAIRLTGRHASLNHHVIEPAALNAPASAGPPAIPEARAGSVFTPRRPAPAASSSAFRFSSDEPQDDPADSETADPRVTTAELTPMGLPVRVRQASLAPQLRDAGPPAGGEPAEPAAGGPSPEAARSTMTALQRGWERGRYVSGAAVPSFAPTPDAEPGEDGDEQRNDE